MSSMHWEGAQLWLGGRIFFRQLANGALLEIGDVSAHLHPKQGCSQWISVVLSSPCGGWQWISNFLFHDSVGMVSSVECLRLSFANW